MKDLIKDFPQSPGIYKITSPNNKIYIGEAVNLRIRCEFYLNKNRIKNQRKIFNSLNKYGVESHKIEIIELCDIDVLYEKERFWQEYFNSVNDGLNCHYTGTKTKKKLHSDETIKIISDKAKGENNAFFGKKHSENSLKKISESSKGVNNPNYGGKFLNDEYLNKQKISNSKKPLIVVDLETNDEKIFINSKELAKYLGVKDNLVRMAKKDGYRIKKRYRVYDLV
jgi:group I intron endonuclease